MVLEFDLMLFVVFYLWHLGQCGDGTCQVVEKVMDKMALEILEVELYTILHVL